MGEEVIEVVEGICGDRVVETHEQATWVLDAILRKPGRNHREVAAAVGVTFEQSERCQNNGHESTEDPVYAELCHLDAVYTRNVLIERVNQAAHWKEQYRDLLNDAEGLTSEAESEFDDGMSDTAV